MPARATPTTSTNVDPATAAADSGTPADVHLYGVNSDLGFASPSGNIQCYLGYNAHCLIRDHTYASPRRPDTCIGRNDNALAVDPTGLSYFVCNTADDLGSNRALPFGSSLISAGFACLSTASGVKCASLSSGHGFVLSRAKVTQF